MVETVWPGIAEIRTTAHRTGNYAGIDPIKWGPTKTFEIKRTIEREDRTRDTLTLTVEYPEWAEVTVYRMVEHQRMPFTARVFWLEAYATKDRDSDEPNAMWAKRPFGQLGKCVEVASLRIAFPEEIGNDYAAEEMEGKTIEGAAIATDRIAAPEEPPKPVDPTEPPKPPEPKAPLPNPGQSIDGKNEVKDRTPADDVNDDDSGVSTELRSPDQLLTDIEFWLGSAKTEDEVEELWSEMDVESEFAHDPDRMGKAIDLKTAALNRINRTAAGENGQAELFTGGAPAAGETSEGGK
jgi:phage recombination protein Bet